MENLAAKYRPRVLEDVTEQGVVVDIVRKICESKDITNRNFLFIGPSGVGKTTIARIIANAINEGKGEPVEVDAASNSGVESVRSLIEQMRIHPVGCKYKVFILDEVHAFSSQSWQALLKTLEEQPAKTIVCLCLAGDGLVFTNSGLKRLDSVVVGDQVWDGSKFRSVINTFNNGVKSCLTVKLKNGTRINCTPNHQIQVLQGDNLVWRRADCIQAGDCILCYHNYTSSSSRDDISLEEAWMLGYITGNGNYTPHSLDLYTPYHKWDRVKYYLDKLVEQKIVKNYIVDGDLKACDNHIHDTRIHFYSNKYCSGMTDWYNKVGADPSYTRGTKKIPNSVFQMNENQIRSFVDGWYFADGDGQCDSFFDLVYNKKECRYSGSPHIYCSNYSMIHNLKVVLQSIGVHTTLYESHVDITEEMYQNNNFIKPGTYVSYTLYRATQVGFFRNDEFKKILIEKYNNMPSGKYKLKLATLKIDSLKARISSTMLSEAGYDYPDKGIFVPVVSVESCGEHNVYDIEVEGSHQFVYNGIVTHNCTTNPEKIPATILSRVQTFQLSKISLDGIYTRLKHIVEEENKEGENITYDEDALLYIAKMAEGGMRLSISLLDKALSYSNNITIQTLEKSLGLPSYDDYFSLLNAIVKKDNQKIVEIINNVYNSGVNFVKWFDGFFSFITNIVKFIYLQDIQKTMIPGIYEDKIKKYTTTHAALCLKLSNKLVKMNQELKTTQYLQELAISYLCSVPQVQK